MTRAAGVLPVLILCCGWAQAQAPVDIVNWRYDEDWSVLRNSPAPDQGFWIPYKYIPLTTDGDVYLSTGLEARWRYEGFEDNLWGTAEAPDDGYTWTRLLPHADLHAGPLRAFGQLIAGYAQGVQPEQGPVDQTGTDLLQGFADLRLPLGGTETFTLRYGRELLALGSERLVGARYGPNVPLAFEGWRGILQLGGTQIQLLDLRPMQIGTGNFDDQRSDTRHLWGSYLSRPSAGLPGTAELYLLIYENAAAQYVDASGRERRNTLGLRLAGQQAAWSWNWEAMYQTGHLDTGSERLDIRAWSLATETGYRFAQLALKPRLRLRANAISGDSDAQDGDLGSFNAMFPKGKYFGELSPLGPSNLFNLHPSVDLELGQNLDLGLAAIAYWRYSLDDGIYDLPGHPILGSSDSHARFIGSQVEAVLGWEPSSILSFSASCSLFAPGAYLEHSDAGETIRMIGLEAQLRF